MGTYVCKLKHGKKPQQYAHTGSREITLRFEGGGKWKMPEMILHYIKDHNWLPPQEFIFDLLHNSLDQSGEDMYIVNPTAQSIDEKFGVIRIGYLGSKIGAGEIGTMPEDAWRTLFHYVTYPDALPGRKILLSFGI